MSSIQIGALVYFTLIVIGAWIFFAVIFLQLKRFINMSCYVPTVSRILTVILVLCTIGGYILIFSPSVMSGFVTEKDAPAKTSGYFDTY